jgi:hypothetical protein
MIEPGEFLRSVIDPALSGLSGIMGRDMASDEARVLLLAIAMQESGLDHRRQINPQGKPIASLARGWWQFERGGGVAGVLAHKSSAEPAKQVCEALQIEPADAATVHEALAWHDHLAVCFARLLLWTDHRPLPDIGDETGAWDCYLRNWRPGKPHRERWSGIYEQAAAVVLVGETHEVTMVDNAAVRKAARDVWTNPERGVLKVAGDKPIEVTLPKMARSWQTGEFWLVALAMVADAAIQFAPIIDPALDQIEQSSWLASNTVAAALFAAARLAYKGWRTREAVKVASAEVAR